jgi:exodeoxyribonuclease VII small subunit
MAMFSPEPSDMTSEPGPVCPEPQSLSSELKRLEEIVRQLDSPDSDLDRALLLFEEGIARLRAARERLAEAETKVQQVLRDAAGQITMRNLDV